MAVKVVKEEVWLVIEEGVEPWKVRERLKEVKAASMDQDVYLRIDQGFIDGLRSKEHFQQLMDVLLPYLCVFIEKEAKVNIQQIMSSSDMEWESKRKFVRQFKVNWFSYLNICLYGETMSTAWVFKHYCACKDWMELLETVMHNWIDTVYEYEWNRQKSQTSSQT